MERGMDEQYARCCQIFLRDSAKLGSIWRKREMKASNKSVRVRVSSMHIMSGDFLLMMQ